jgi:hypothetical protein
MKRVAAVVAILGLFVMGSAAALADTELFPGANRPAGEAGVIALNPGASLTIDMPAAGAVPGAVSRVRHIIANTTGAALRYALKSESANADGKGLRSVLNVTITACDGADPTPLYTGPLGPATAGFGDTRIGADPGDRVLEPGERATLCFETAMSPAAGNEFQGATTRTTWTIRSEQVAGNA